MNKRFLNYGLECISCQSKDPVNLPELNERDFIKALKAMFSDITVNRDFEVPYLAGYSEDGKVIYIDREFNSDFNGIDILEAIVTHEAIEKALEVSYQGNFQYPQAHQIALHLEKQVIVDFGLNWEEYDQFVQAQIQEIYARKDYQYLPPDLDLQPYLDDPRDFDCLKRMNRSGAN